MVWSLRVLVSALRAPALLFLPQVSSPQLQVREPPQALTLAPLLLKKALFVAVLAWFQLAHAGSLTALVSQLLQELKAHSHWFRTAKRVNECFHSRSYTSTDDTNIQPQQEIPLDGDLALDSGSGLTLASSLWTCAGLGFGSG